MRKTFDKYARAYDETVVQYYENTKNIEPAEIKIREDFISRLRPGEIILDIGCGPGRDAKFFSERGFDVIGIDLSPKSVDMAKKIAPQARFKVMNFLGMQFRKNSFGGAWFSAGLIVVEKKYAAKMLRSIHRILKTSGILFISVKEGTGEGFELDKRYGNERYFSYFRKEEIRKLIEKSGFKILKIFKPELKSKYHTHPWISILCIKK